MADDLSKKISIILDVFNKGKGKILEHSKEVKVLTETADKADKAVKKVDKAVDSLGKSSASSTPKLANASKQILSLSTSSGAALRSIIRLTGPLAALTAAISGIVFSVKSAVEFESAMADVRKVVTATESEIAGLSKGIMAMSREIPRSAVELAAIAAAAGQLGVATPEIEGFVRVVAKMSTAFEMTAEEAGTALGKIKNIFSMSIPELETFGDVINQLGNNTAAREREIVNSMMRIGASAKTFGLATTETAALSAALISLGKAPEEASTSINAMLSKLQTAEVGTAQFKSGLAMIGMSAEQMAASIEKGPQAAITNLLDSLKALDAKDRSAALVKMFGLEHQASIGTLVEGLDSYKDALEKVGDKAAYAGSMQKEFEARSKTTSNQLVLAKNAINEAGIAIGDSFLPALNSMTKGFAYFMTGIADFLAQHPVLTNAMDEIVKGFGRIASSLGTSWVGQIITDGINTVIGALVELNAMMASGQIDSYLKSQVDQWALWGTDISAMITKVKDLFTLDMSEMGKLGKWTIDTLTDAFKNFPANVRAFIGIMTVEVAAGFDKVLVNIKAFKNDVKAAFSDRTFASVEEERKQQMKVVDEARYESIKDITDKRKADVEGSEKETRDVRKSYDDARSEMRRASGGSDEKVEQDGSKKIDESKPKPEDKPKEVEVKVTVEQESKQKYDLVKNPDGTWSQDVKPESVLKDEKASGSKMEPAVTKADIEKRKNALNKEKNDKNRKEYTAEEFKDRQDYWKDLEDEGSLTKDQLKEKKAEEAKFNKEQRGREKADREEAKAEKTKATAEAKKEKKNKAAFAGRKKQEAKERAQAEKSNYSERAYDDRSDEDREKYGADANHDGRTTEKESRAEDKRLEDIKKEEDSKRPPPKTKSKGAISAHGGALTKEEWQSLSKTDQDSLVAQASRPRSSWDYFSNKTGSRFKNDTDPSVGLANQAKIALQMAKTKKEQEEWTSNKTKSKDYVPINADELLKKAEEDTKKRLEQEKIDHAKKLEQKAIDDAKHKERNAKLNAEYAEKEKKDQEELAEINAKRIESAKKGAEEWAQAEEKAVEKAKSVFQQYADKVRSLQNEISGREESLAEKLDSIKSTGTDESKWQKKRKDAMEYEKAAKAAMAIGDYDKAQEMSDKAGGIYEKLKGGAGSIGKTVGDQAAYSGVKSAGELGIAIAKAQQGEAAKAAMSATGSKGATSLGQASSMSSDSWGGQKVDKVHELRFAGGKVTGAGMDVEALLDIIAKAGMAAA